MALDNSVLPDPLGPTAVRFYGLVIESAGYGFEGYGGVSGINVDCIADFEPLVADYDLEAKFAALEAEKGHAAGYGGSGEEVEVDEARKQELCVDLVNFRREFKVR